MTSALLPPTHQRLGPLMCGWWSETLRGPYRTMADVEHDMRSIDFAAQCGIDVISDGRTWAGETLKVNAFERIKQLLVFFEHGYRDVVKVGKGGQQLSHPLILCVEIYVVLYRILFGLTFGSGQNQSPPLLWSQ